MQCGVFRKLLELLPGGFKAIELLLSLLEFLSVHASAGAPVLSGIFQVQHLVKHDELDQ